MSDLETYKRENTGATITMQEDSHQISDFSERLRKMVEHYDNLTPEQRAEHQAQVEAHRIASAKRDLLERAKSLQEKWNAPTRAEVKTGLIIEGPWGETLVKLKSKLGTGFLIGLIGGRGPGKTQLGVELMRANTDMGESAYYATATEFFMMIKKSYGNKFGESEFDIIHRLRKPKLLVLDETGKRAETEWENRLLFELIDKRYQDMTDTLLISNEAQPDFVLAVGPSIASRMQETGGIIQCTWPSFRK